MTTRAKADVEESLDTIEELRDELLELERDLAGEIEEIEERWEDVARQTQETVITPYKKNIRIELFGIAWIPHWRVQVGERIEEVPGNSSMIG
jgi:low affinity Fe/Cu permease